ncbi:uncharacterized protein LOC119303418 [Triticum dicoccoides]|uniref:uncharacterized protein LOC119303418 n=1 Tax=Triticum dicoccoides TaxID=85692 RepID=UPI00188F32C2|nr:uncharacterized protein LOC119303418 [Triticum dicoccoides]
MLVLFETPTGFAVFKVLNKGKLDKLKDLWKEFTTSDSARKNEVASIEEMQSQFPSDAVYYTESEDTQQSIEATPPSVKIPYRMMLDVLLESLGLPLAEYRTKVCEDGLKLQRIPFSFRYARLFFI